MVRTLMKFLPALALCLTFSATAADGRPSASAGNIDQPLNQCLNDPEKQSTGDQDECIVNATHAWDARLNASYLALRDDLPEAARPALLAAQRAWLASRNADLTLIAAVYATVRGTMYAPMNANDVMVLTQRRAQTLTRYGADLENASAGAFRLDGRLMPAKIEREDGGSAVPQRGLGFERKHCQGLTEAASLTRCADQAVQYYIKDIDEQAQRIERRLPGASRGAMRASADKWRLFASSEKALVSAVCPAADTSLGQACRAVQARNEALTRLQQLVHLEALIGAD
ncbi:lysozyme inhibitor LprI family protein [Pandoraea apista]|uniref:lysozyme inhibitor LprI family protein n=1 Tax=Pandoraea apista TaxID=93218 RepID=UPI0011B04C95|nr:lysozyme inhibitor LprI family protein [Pandoraea apista]